MTGSEPEVLDLTSSKHRVEADTVGVMSEIIGNVDDTRSVLRELLSNSSAKEVGAKNIEISVYGHEKGLAFTIRDDGCGMNYTEKEAVPGRLNRFLNVAQGEQAGLSSDEFGYKGMGTILLYNSKRFEVETYDGHENVFRALVEEPKKTIEMDKKVPEPKLFRLKPDDVFGLSGTGTNITAYGYGDYKGVPKDFELDSLERYLRFNSVVGYTLDRPTTAPLPKFKLTVNGKSKFMEAGFQYIGNFEEGSEVSISDSGKTLSFGPKVFSDKTENGKTINLMFKGSITVDTGRYKLSDNTGGVFFSQNGIPYFEFNYYNEFGRILNLTSDWFRIVCDSSDVKLDLSRSDFNYDLNYDKFTELVKDAMNWIKGTKEFQNWYSNYRHSVVEELQTFMNEKKAEFQDPETEYVWHDGKIIHSVPVSEWDTTAILWKLEAIESTPFSKFLTLQYAGRQKGVDLLVDFQESKESEFLNCVYIEVEEKFSNFIKHKHDAKQMRSIICWKVDGVKGGPGKLEKTGIKWKYHYNVGDTVIPVFEISNFPGLKISTKSGSEVE